MSNNKKDLFVLHWKTKDERKLSKDQNIVYVPLAYRQACFDIVRRHNPSASKEEIYAEYDRCLQLAKKHNFPTKAILSMFCYSYFCPSDITFEKEKPLNITENTIDMTKFFKSLPTMEDERLKSIYKNCLNAIAKNKPNKEEAEFRSKVIERELKRRSVLPEKNKLKSSDVFFTIMGIAAICAIISNIMGI